jgi:NADPH-dependent ferric siderophore reductase
MHILKQKGLSYLEGLTARTGLITAIRTWNPATIYEIDLHLPQVNMHNWQNPKRAQVKIAEGAYRDYTLANWNSQNQTCTLIIDAAHTGMGSQWVKTLQKNDTLTYLGLLDTGRLNTTPGNIYCIGDATAIGHFMAIQQITQGKSRVSGAVVLHQPTHVAHFKNNFKTNIEPVPATNGNSYQALANWVTQQPFTNQMVYIAGNKATIAKLRNLIRPTSGFKGSIRLNGFWQ